MAETNRQKKFNRMLQKELSEIIQRMLSKDSRNIIASVAQVRTSPDLMVVRVYITAYPDRELKQIVEMLNSRNKEIRRSLGDRLKELRRVPEITFFIDDTAEYSMKMEALFDQIRREKKVGTSEEE